MPLLPEVEAMLAREAALGLPPRSQRTIAQTREIYLRSRLSGGVPAPVPEIEDLDANGIPVRIYRPGRDDAGVLVYFHGGRFISGGLDSHDPVCRSLAAQSGWTVAAVDYRLAPEHRFPAALDDCYAALNWVARRFAPPRLAVGGDSAGGNLAAACALLARDRGGPPLAGQMLTYPMLDATCSLPSHGEFACGPGPGSADMKRGWDEYLAGGTDPKYALASPLFAPDLSGLPPAYVLTVEYDSLRDEGEAYAQRLGAAGVPVRHTHVDGAIHGIFQMAGILKTGRQAMEEAARWLRDIR